jgi:hypothetical protein
MQASGACVPSGPDINEFTANMMTPPTPPGLLRFFGEARSLDSWLGLLRGTGLDEAWMRQAAEILVLRKALQDNPVVLTVDESMKTRLLNQFAGPRGVSNPVALKRWLKEYRLTLDALMMRLIQSERIERLKAVLISEDSVRERFLAEKRRFDQVVFGIIRLKKESAAQEIHSRLTHDNEDFCALARQFSIGPEAAQAGIRGPVPVQDLNPELREQLLRLKAGDISAPFALKDLFFIVRLFRLEPAQLTEERRKAYRDVLFEDWMERQLALAGSHPRPSSSSSSSSVDVSTPSLLQGDSCLEKEPVG